MALQDKQFGVILKKFDDIDKRFDVQEINNNNRFNQITTTLDEISVIIKRLDQERLFTFEIVKRMQKDIENQQKEINKVKQVLNIK